MTALGLFSFEGHSPFWRSFKGIIKGGLAMPSYALPLHFHLPTVLVWIDPIETAVSEGSLTGPISKQGEVENTELKSYQS